MRDVLYVYPSECKIPIRRYIVVIIIYFACECISLARYAMPSVELRNSPSNSYQTLVTSRRKKYNQSLSELAIPTRKRGTQHKKHADRSFIGEVQCRYLADYVPRRIRPGGKKRMGQNDKEGGILEGTTLLLWCFARVWLGFAAYRTPTVLSGKPS